MQHAAASAVHIGDADILGLLAWVHLAAAQAKCALPHLVQHEQLQHTANLCASQSTTPSPNTIDRIDSPLSPRLPKKKKKTNG